MATGVFVVSLLLALALTPLAARFGRRWGLVDQPGGRRRHAGAVPRLGAPPLLLAWLGGVAVIYWLAPPTGDDALRLRGVVLGSLIVFAGGLLDDWRELPPGGNALIQATAAAVAIGHIIFIEVFTNPLDGAQVWIRPRLLALLISLIWMMGVMNAVNFLDGLDGLAAGVGIVAAFMFAIHSQHLAQTTVALFPLALAGALLGFLPFNFAPARIFMGAGATLVGYQLATLAILSPAKIATALLVLAIPLLDVAWLILTRLRGGQWPWEGDRRHLHFRLLDRGWPVRLIVVGYYAIAVLLGLVAVSTASPGQKLLLLILITGALLFLFISLSRRGPEGESGR